MNAAEFNQRLIAAANRLRQAEAEYEGRIAAHAEAERQYKLGEAKALLMIDEYKNVQERAAMAEMLKIEDDATLNALRYHAHLAEGMRDAAKQAVANRRQEMSALQSLASLAKEEAAFIRTAPSEVTGP